MFSFVLKLIHRNTLSISVQVTFQTALLTMNTWTGQHGMNAHLASILLLQMFSEKELEFALMENMVEVTVQRMSSKLRDYSKGRVQQKNIRI